MGVDFSIYSLPIILKINLTSFPIGLIYSNIFAIILFLIRFHVYSYSQNRGNGNEIASLDNGYKKL